VKPRLTIRDIAREAGVSTATVSRVMNSPESVAPDTRCAVQTVIDRHGYLSHGIAMSLASSRSMSIGLVIPTIINSIYASSTQAIQGIAQAAGYTVLLGVSEFSPELEEKIIRQLLERRVDGLILTGGERKRAIYDMIEANGVPYVVTWKLLPGNAGPPSVSFDNHRGGLVAMEHLIALGHRKIGLICGRSALNDRARERRASNRTGGARQHGRCEHKKPERSVDPDGSIALAPTTSIAAVSSIKAIPTILYIVCRTTGMRFAAVARVTEDRWIRNRASVGLGNGISFLETSRRRCQTKFFGRLSRSDSFGP
jgi:DNA-binding LacI/PurR family transcriptional regulator